jgi:hypothetical protein
LGSSLLPFIIEFDIGSEVSLLRRSNEPSDIKPWIPPSINSQSSHIFPLPSTSTQSKAIIVLFSREFILLLAAASLSVVTAAPVAAPVAETNAEAAPADYGN